MQSMFRQLQFSALTTKSQLQFLAPAKNHALPHLTIHNTLSNTFTIGMCPQTLIANNPLRAKCNNMRLALLLYTRFYEPFPTLGELPQCKFDESIQYCLWIFYIISLFYYFRKIYNQKKNLIYFRAKLKQFEVKINYLSNINFGDAIWRSIEANKVKNHTHTMLLRVELLVKEKNGMNKAITRTMGDSMLYSQLWSYLLHVEFNFLI